MKEEILLMENNIDIEQIKKTIQQLKLEIIEREDKIDELLKIINNENNEEQDD